MLKKLEKGVGRTMSSQNSQIAQVVGPNHVFGLGYSNRAESSLLLHVVQRDHVALLDEQVARAREEDLLGVGELNLLGDLVLQVLDQDRVIFVEHGETIARHPDGVQARRASSFGSCS